MMNQRMRGRRRGEAGFTLVELMVVIAIIAVLATVVGVNALKFAGEGDRTAAKAQIQNFKTALIAYKLQVKRLPETLDQLVNNERGTNYLDAPQVPNDPWGNPYVYTRESNSKFTIVSLGADGQQGGTGEDADISSEDLGAD